MEVNGEMTLRLLTALRVASRFVERGVAEHPLDELDVGILTLAEATGGQLRPSHASAQLKVAAPTVTRHVRALQHAGRLSVIADTGDGRGYRIALTEAGASMLADFREGLVARFAPALEGWSPEQVRALADGLARLNHAMETAQARLPAPGGGSWWRAPAAVTDLPPASDD